MGVYTLGLICVVHHVRQGSELQAVLQLHGQGQATYCAYVVDGS
jgi:hypothetical protein